jgi:hypothetical protein
VELAVKPEDLHAAAVALSACAHRLEEACDAFAGAAAREVPELGREAVAAAGTSAARAQHAVTTIADDVAQLARALKLLAAFYGDVDRHAVGG